MPARGSAASDVEISELHEVIAKYSTAHSLIVGGDFNASLHRSSGPVKRDKLLESFLAEHQLFLPDNFSVRPTYRHEVTGAISVIDYWLKSERNQQTTFGLLCALNLSDHVEIELSLDRCIGSTIVLFQVLILILQLSEYLTNRPTHAICHQFAMIAEWSPSIRRLS